MKQLCCILWFFGLSAALLAQDAEQDVIRLKNSEAVQAVEQVQPGSRSAASKAHLNVNLGSSFSYMHGYGSLMGFSVMPTYTIPLNNRWSLHTGVIGSHYYGLNTLPYEGLNQHPAMSSLAVFAAASYRMSDHLVLHGAGVKTLMEQGNLPLLAYPSDRLSLGATYKFSDHFSVGASIQVNRGPAMMNYSPFYSPFGW